MAQSGSATCIWGRTAGITALSRAAEQFFADLQDYLACAKAAAGELGTVKLWHGRYSRGAAVANLAAARVRRELPQIAPENTYVYTFGSPGRH